MTPSIPRFSDLKSLQAMSKVLAFPMVMASAVAQSGLPVYKPNLDWLSHASVAVLVLSKVLFYTVHFVGTGFWPTICAGLIYGVLAIASLRTNANWLVMAACVFLAFGIYGLSVNNESIRDMGLHPLWFYTAVAYAFFLYAADKEINTKNTSALNQSD